MKTKHRPYYKAFYQAELAKEITGKSPETLKRRAKRHNWTLAEVIKDQIIKNYLKR